MKHTNQNTEENFLATFVKDVNHDFCVGVGTQNIQISRQL